jgi:hypothetical protein
MKIREILELTQLENVATIAKNHLTIGEKKLRDTLKSIGCTNQAGKKGWIYTGDSPEVLEKSIYEFAKPKANYRRNERKKETTEEQKNIPTNERNHDIIKEQIEKPTKEEGNKMRKRASFDIESELLKELKIYAIREEKNVYEIVENAIRMYLKERE